MGEEGIGEGEDVGAGGLAAAGPLQVRGQTFPISTDCTFAQSHS